MSGGPWGERGTIEAPVMEKNSPANSMLCTRSRSRNRPVSRSRMIASSSHESASARIASTTSPASRNAAVQAGSSSTRPDAGKPFGPSVRRPKFARSAADEPATMRAPARPWLA